ncbi:MAG: NAD(P)-dependent oxidoreductase [Spirochaetales bacterium]|nr:NAD(P)-dependent oxidoreductase [Spirochaetales bacterium]
MAVLITGGNGHIGSWTAYLIARSGGRVIIYDRNTALPDYLIPLADKIDIIEGDVLDLARLSYTLKKYSGQLEGIIHTVAVMGELVQQNPYYNVGLNVNGFLNVLETARLFNINKLVYTSTGAVYGEAEGTVSEEQPAVPADLYSSTKISCEYIGFQYAKLFNLDFRVARVYFVYGPGKYPSKFINLYKIAFGALEGLTGLNIESGGDQQLDFTYAEDAGQGVFLLFKAKNPAHSIYNIATGSPHSVQEAADLSMQYTHFPVKVHIGKGRLMPRCEALDISRAKKELKYRPKYSLEEGTKLYADWLKEQREH